MDAYDHRLVSPDWAFEFHGHRCPFMPLGFRMGRLALERFGVDREKDHTLHVFAELGEGHPQTCLAALFNAAALIAISALIAREAVVRILHPEPVNAPVMLVAAIVALVANLASVFLLRTHSAEDLNVRSAFLHLLQDALASLAVVVAALFARTAAGAYVDPVAAILIAIIVLRSALAIVWESLHTLLEAAPANLNVEDLAEAVTRRFPEVRLHHIHAWEVGPGQKALTAHMKLGAVSVCDAERVASEIRGFLREEWDIAHTTLEAEANGCGAEQILGEWK